MKTEVFALEVPTVDATAGTAKYVGDLRDATVYIHGVGVASLKVQVKVASKQAITASAKPTAEKPTAPVTEDDWIDLKAGIAAAALVPLADQTTGARLTITHVRIFRTSGTGTTPAKAAISGRNVH
jgi:hypothetical protein